MPKVLGEDHDNTFNDTHQQSSEIPSAAAQSLLASQMRTSGGSPVSPQLISPMSDQQMSETSEVFSRDLRPSQSSQLSEGSPVEGLHLLLYKDESSFSNMHTPCAVLPLDNCIRLCSLPTHSKSEYTFTITVNNRDLLFYADTK